MLVKVYGHGPAPLPKFQKPYTRDKIISLITYGVLYLAKVDSLPNEEKKPLLLATIKDVINGTDLDAYQKELMIDIIDTIGDSIVESLIILGKDTVAFVKKGVGKCKSWCARPAASHR
jgi:hypothetical protein